jgi:transposase
VNGRGRPVRLLLTPGQHGDPGQVPALLEGLRPRAVIADKGYDSRAVAALVRKKRARVVIPSQASRARRRRIDWEAYKGRNVAERFWARVKQCRRVATRYDKKAHNFLAFVQLASILLLAAA